MGEFVRGLGLSRALFMVLEETAGEGWWGKETTCDYRGGRAVSVCECV